MFKPLHAFLAICTVAAIAVAQDSSDVDYPDSYVVQPGDTLWDIAEQFLIEPWMWPEIWYVNPDISNPHKIYPGDILDLSIVGGQPRLSIAQRGGGTIKLSPSVRREQLTQAIEPIPLSDIRDLFGKRTILERTDTEGLPYVVAVEETHVAGVEAQRIYVRGLAAEPGAQLAVVRPTTIFRQVENVDLSGTELDRRQEFEEWDWPGRKGVSKYHLTRNNFWQHVFFRAEPILGYEVMQVAVGEVVSGDDPTTLYLIESDKEVLVGDFVVPMFAENFDSEFIPRSPLEVPANTRVIGLSNALFGAGRHQVVAINRGAINGVEPGQVYSVFRPGRVVRDEVRYPDGHIPHFFLLEKRRDAKVELPDEYAGHLMVFKTHEQVSYGLVMRAERPIKVLDELKLP